MTCLTISITDNNFNKYLNMLENEEEKNEILWKDQYSKNLKKDDWIFFVSYKKTIRIHRVKEIREENILLKNCLGEMYWRDWDYIINGKSNYFKEGSYLLNEIKSRTIINIIESKI